jgi:hypothetical protein
VVLAEGLFSVIVGPRHGSEQSCLEAPAVGAVDPIECCVYGNQDGFEVIGFAIWT